MVVHNVELKFSIKVVLIMANDYYLWPVNGDNDKRMNGEKW